jgi:hypothetical protein
VYNAKVKLKKIVPDGERISDENLNQEIDERLERGDENDVNRIVPPIETILTSLTWDPRNNVRVMDLISDAFDKSSIGRSISAERDQQYFAELWYAPTPP